MRQKPDPVLRCSFCHKTQSDVGKLIGNPSDYPRAYICNECISFCAAILEDEVRYPEPEPEVVELLQRVEHWIKQEASGHDATAELNELRSAAKLMFVNPDA